MTGTVRIAIVDGTVYKYWSDFFNRCTYAEREDGKRKKISESGYVHNDLTVRKAIAAAFGQGTFRKKTVKK